MRHTKTVAQALTPPIGARTAAITVLLGAVGGIGLAYPLHSGVAAAELATLATLLAVAAATTAAILAHLAARLGGDTRAAWAAVALGVYGIAAIPAATLDAQTELGGARVVAHALVLGAFVLVRCGPRLILRLGAPACVLAALAVTLIAGQVTALLGPADAAAANRVLRILFAAGMAVTGASLLVQGVDRRRSAVVELGAGAVLLGLAHLLPAVAADPTARLAVASAGMRLAAVVVLAVGALHLLRDAVRRLDEAQAAHEEQLRRAAIRLDRTVERDHELRNGLAGLAGAAGLLASDRAGPEAEMLGAAVASELDRLNALLRRSVCPQHPPVPVPYDALSVIRSQVALRVGAGMEITVEHRGAVPVRGCPDVLAQVLANLLANCAGHAPGSRVHVSVDRRGDRVIVRVADDGPGIAPGTERAVLEPGARRYGSPGGGLGLHLCRRLLADEGATIEIGRSDGGRGCTVTVALPAAAGVDR